MPLCLCSTKWGQGLRLWPPFLPDGSPSRGELGLPACLFFVLFIPKEKWAWPDGGPKGKPDSQALSSYLRRTLLRLAGKNSAVERRNAQGEELWMHNHPAPWGAWMSTCLRSGKSVASNTVFSFKDLQWGKHVLKRPQRGWKEMHGEGGTGTKTEWRKQHCPLLTFPLSEEKGMQSKRPL